MQTPSPPTLDELFARSVLRQPQALALCDAPDKHRITGTAPLRLTYSEADQAVSALGVHFAEAGLAPGSIVAVQLPNTVDLILTLLAASRAGITVALLPLLWRQADLASALHRIGARAIITARQIDGVNHAELALQAAAETFSVRYVGGFGHAMPDGVVPLTEIMEGPADNVPASADPNRAAVVTFDVTMDGPRAIPRSHIQLIAGGLAVQRASDLPTGATLASATLPLAFGPLASSFVLWLLGGGTLVLHHPFDEDVLARQLAEEACEGLVIPAPLAFRIAETALFDGLPILRRVVGLWRAPEQVLSSPRWPSTHAAFSDVYLFGEAGLVGVPRRSDGAVNGLFEGPYGAAGRTGHPAGEIAVTPQGTLALRGPMVPLAAYTPLFRAEDAPPPEDVDTGYAVRRARVDNGLFITAPPNGLVSVGGYRFRSDDLQDWARRLSQGAMLTALPDRMNGHRLAGRATENDRARSAFLDLGLNPLMVEAFRDRTSGN